MKNKMEIEKNNMYVLQKALINAEQRRKSKPIEFAEKQLKHAKEKFEHHLNLYQQNENELDLFICDQLRLKIKKIQAQIEMMKNAPTPRFVKEIEIARLSKQNGLDDYIIEWREEAEKAIAIVDEIFESDYCTRTKLRLIKLYLNGKITTLELDAFLTE